MQQVALVFLLSRLVVVTECSTDNELFKSRSVRDLNDLIYANQSGPQLKPDETLKLLKELHQLQIAARSSREEIEDIGELVSLSSAQFYGNKILYEGKFNERMNRWMEMKNIADYIYHQYRIHLHSSNKKESLPSFMINYHQRWKHNHLESKDLWTDFINSNDKEPEETLGILRKIYDTSDRNDPKRVQIEILLNLEHFDYANCSQLNIIATESVSESLAKQPNVVRYMEHFRDMKQQDCHWLSMLGGLRLYETCPNGINCDELFDHNRIRMNLRDIYIKSRGVLANPKICDDSWDKAYLSRLVLEMGSCIGVDCCNVILVRPSFTDLLFSISSSNVYIYMKEITHRIDKICKDAIKQSLEPTTRALNSQLDLILPADSVFFPNDLLKWISKDINCKCNSRIKQIKLEKLDELVVKPCNEIIKMATPIIEGNKPMLTYLKTLLLRQSNQLPPLTIAWFWCRKWQSGFKLVRVAIELDRTHLFSSTISWFESLEKYLDPNVAG